MILVQPAILYSNVPPMGADLTEFMRRRIWDVDLGLDVAFDVFILIRASIPGQPW